jgi:hypothetical protein
MNKYKQLSEEARALRSKVKMCLSKRAYNTKEAAMQKSQRVYQCKHCGKWHRSGQFAKFVNYLKHKAGNQPTPNLHF